MTGTRDFQFANTGTRGKRDEKSRSLTPIRKKRDWVRDDSEARTEGCKEIWGDTAFTQSSSGQPDRNDLTFRLRAKDGPDGGVREMDWRRVPGRWW